MIWLEMNNSFAMLIVVLWDCCMVFSCTLVFFLLMISTFVRGNLLWNQGNILFYIILQTFVNSIFEEEKIQSFDFNSKSGLCIQPTNLSTLTTEHVSLNTMHVRFPCFVSRIYSFLNSLLWRNLVKTFIRHPQKKYLYTNLDKIFPRSWGKEYHRHALLTLHAWWLVCNQKDEWFVSESALILWLFKSKVGMCIPSMGLLFLFTG